MKKRSYLAKRSISGSWVRASCWLVWRKFWTLIDRSGRISQNPSSGSHLQLTGDNQFGYKLHKLGEGAEIFCKWKKLQVTVGQTGLTLSDNLLMHFTHYIFLEVNHNNKSIERYEQNTMTSRNSKADVFITAERLKISAIGIFTSAGVREFNEVND